MRKAVYYMLVSSSDYPLDTDSTQMPNDPGIAIEVPPPPSSSESEKNHPSNHHSERLLPLPEVNGDAHQRNLSHMDAKRCTQLMTRFIDHFTPILFTPPATPHMACTDVFADTWMSLVIQHAIENDSVYKPLETLERMKGTD